MKGKLVAAVAVAAILGAWLYWRIQRAERWDAAYKAARDAYSRAAEYKDAGILLYEPRYKDLEVSMDSLKGMDAPDSSKDLLATELDSCVQSVSFYRADISRVDELTDNINDLARTEDLEPTAARKAKDAQIIASTRQLANDNLRDAGKAATAILSCIDNGKTD
jgi:endonuclease III-like uncharacterized protein